MLHELSKSIKIITTILIVLGALTGLGYGLNNIIPWNWLDNMFIIIRKTVMLLDFAVDTQVLFACITIWINISVLYWLYLSGAWIIKKLEK
jgi:hypothetical protein